MFKRYAPALVAVAVGCGAQTGVVGEAEQGIGSQREVDAGSDGASTPSPGAGDGAEAESDSGMAPIADDMAPEDTSSEPGADVGEDSEGDVTNPPSEIDPNPTPSDAGSDPGPVQPATDDMPPAQNPDPVGSASAPPEPCLDGTEIALPAPEIATRLSRLLFNAAPSEQLLEQAEAGELATYGQVECAASEMLQEPEAADGLLAFLDTWLQFQAWPYEPDPALDTLDAPVWTEMKDQAHAFLMDFAASNDTTLERLLTEQQSYVGPQLANHLGLQPTEDLPAVITVPQQRGFLSLGFVTASLNRIGQRGSWTMETLQCIRIPPKPPDVMLPTLSEDEGYQQSYFAALSNPACTGCHSVLDPYGLGLENFDSFGRYRTEEAGAPLVVSGTLTDDTASENNMFTGLDEFTTKLANNGQVARCIADTMLRHAAGVDITLADPQVMALTRAKLLTPFEASGRDLSSLLVAVTQVDSFWE
jgi:hypothetical protein